jgi:hypothetical protein
MTGPTTPCDWLVTYDIFAGRHDILANDIFAGRHDIFVGLARTIYIRCMYGIFDREIIKYTVIYGVYKQFWPTLYICRQA